MKNDTPLLRFIYILLLLVATVLLPGCNAGHGELPEINEISPLAGMDDLPDNGGNHEIAVEAPPFTEGIFPCTDCHTDMEVNPDRRPLVDMHDDIDAIFDHDSDNRWCLDCHDANNRDYLRLASGKLISFDESYKLCGQCHGDKLRDWKVGVHGKRTGYWNGKKQYLLCVHCHNPHSPKFPQLEPLPPPVAQEHISR